MPHSTKVVELPEERWYCPLKSKCWCVTHILNGAMLNILSTTVEIFDIDIVVVQVILEGDLWFGVENHGRVCTLYLGNSCIFDN